MITLNTLLDSVLDAQCASGAFPATVDLHGQILHDENGFVTALVVDELSWHANRQDVRSAIRRGLDFLLRCEYENLPGHFGFYPLDRSPDWLTAPLRPDADDTALFALLLFRNGVRHLSSLRETVRDVLAPHRLLFLAEWCKPWYERDVYFTWLDEGLWPNVVDCCVNINVLSLLGASGVADPKGAAAIVAMVHRGLQWAGDSAARAAVLSPWYPHALELYWTVERAVRAGCDELRPALQAIARTPWGTPNHDGDEAAPVCGSLDGQVMWRCPLLHRLRSARWLSQCYACRTDAGV